LSSFAARLIKKPEPELYEMLKKNSCKERVAKACPMINSVAIALRTLHVNPVAIALRTLHLNPVAIALRTLHVNPVAIALRTLHVNPVAIALRTLDVNPVAIALRNLLQGSQSASGLIMGHAQMKMTIICPFWN
jgi:hypothetical protein